MNEWKRLVRSVTPAEARALLEHGNPNNRAIDWNRVEAYADAMRRGLWIVSPESGFSIADEGTLLNGHHRLHAVIRAAVAVQFVVFTNVPWGALRHIDDARPRSIQQISRMFGEDTSWDDALKVILRLRTKKPFVSDVALQDAREEFADPIRLAMETAKLKVGGRKLNAGTRAGLLLLSQHHPNSASTFMTDFRQMAERRRQAAGGPANLIRWLENRTHRSGSGEAGDACRAVVRAFAQWAAGLHLGYVRGAGSRGESLDDYVVPPSGSVNDT